jgi:hypothetical protein
LVEKEAVEVDVLVGYSRDGCQNTPDQVKLDLCTTCAMKMFQWIQKELGTFKDEVDLGTRVIQNWKKRRA